MAEQEKPQKKREKTIDLSEWQKKNQAYLEKRAKERAEKEKEKEESEVAPSLSSGEEEDKSKKESLTEDTDNQESSTEESEKDEDSQSSNEDEDRIDDTNDGVQDDEEGDSDKSDEETPESLDEDEDSQIQALEILADEKKERLARQRALALKASPIFLVAFIMILVGAYFISPWSRTKHISISGNKQLAKADILAASGILAEDYTVTTALQQGSFAKSIRKTLPLVKSAKVTYQFPVTFKITVEEYYTLAYVKDGQAYHSVLSSGEVLSDQVEGASLPPSALVIQMTDLAMVKKLVLSLDLLDAQMVAKMQRIELSATPASKDLLRILTVEGHEILVPLGEVTKKLPYYEKILPKLTVPSIIDMEVGLYSYPK